MASLNFITSSNMITLLTNLVFIGVFNFWGCNLLSTHALSYSCLPFLDFFVHVIVFCKLPWVAFTLTCFRLVIIYSSLVAYWQALNIMWPKHLHIFINMLKFQRLILAMERNVVAINSKLLLSSFTKAIIWCIRSYFSSNECNWPTMESLVISWTSNKPMVMCWGIRDSFK